MKGLNTTIFGQMLYLIQREGELTKELTEQDPDEKYEAIMFEPIYKEYVEKRLRAVIERKDILNKILSN